MSRRNHLALATLLFVSGILTGCGYQQANPGACVTGPLLSSQSGAPNFTLVPTNPNLTIYPGQTEQLSVLIQPVGNATGTVQLGGSYPQGLTVTGVSAAIGSTANITITAANNISYACFTASPGVFDAGQTLTITGTSSSGSVSQQVGLDVVLQNPTFVPAVTNLPILSVTTVDNAPVDSEDDYVDATLTITDPTTKSNNYTGTMGIKGHGNSTWLMPKKPYRLNLDSKAPLLGMASDSNWILLANYDDKSMLRNDVSFQMSQMFGMAWTPSSQFVEMYLNGVYNGTYELTEKVEVSKARLNIGSIDDTDNSGTDLTGGYLAEIDHYDGETFMLRSLFGLPVGIYDPDPPTTEQSAYFTTVFAAAEGSMTTNNVASPTSGWQAYWNKPSVVDWFLVEELAGNQDADDFSSDYFYKPRADPLFYRGPVWDMDITMGNDNYSVIEYPNAAWVGVTSKWYFELMKDPAFVQAVKEQWTAIRPQIVTLPAYIDSRSATLTLAAQNNFSRWPNLGVKVWPNSEAAGSYSGEITFMKSWLTKRITYMDSQYLLP